ncbi:MAG: type II secretion system F family protein [Gammaproteobacteria bacterium]|nr:type II secretion system F family protein [Gammaproteobacteria bacterium]
MSEGLMIFLAMVFVAVALLSQGLIVPVFSESRQMRKRLQSRLDEVENESGEESFSSLLRQKYLRDLSPFERQLEDLPAMQYLARVIAQGGHKFLAYRVALLAAVLAIVGAIVTWVMMRSIPFAFLGLAMGGGLPFFKIFRDRANRIQVFEEQLPDAIDMVKRALRAGHPFSGAIKLVADEMDDPVAGEFGTTFADINYGNDSRRAMLGLLQRVPSVTVMALVTSVLVQRETGGNLAEILERISAVIRGRFKLQRKVKTLSAEGRMSAWILALVPLVLFAVIWVTTPEYLPMLLEEEAGKKMIIYGAISSIVGIFWIKKIIRIEV